MVYVTLPPVATHCCRCHREVGMSHLPWSVPVTNGDTGETRCTYCDEIDRGIDLASLKLPRKSLNSMKAWLLTKAPKPTKVIPQTAIQRALVEDLNTVDDEELEAAAEVFDNTMKQQDAQETQELQDQLKGWQSL